METAYINFSFYTITNIKGIKISLAGYEKVFLYQGKALLASFNILP